MSARQLAVLVGGIAVVVAVFLLVRPGADAPTPVTSTPSTAEEIQTAATEEAPVPEEKPKPEGPEPIVIDVEGGQPIGGVAKIEAKKGEEVAFTVKADAPEEVHVHGFNVSAEVDKGKPAKFDFTADLDGIYEVELENSAVPIAELEIRP